MKQIKSEKAKQYINHVCPHPNSDDKELVAILTDAIKIAETEADERQAKEIATIKAKAIDGCDILRCTIARTLKSQSKTRMN